MLVNGLRGYLNFPFFHKVLLVFFNWKRLNLIKKTNFTQILKIFSLTTQNKKKIDEKRQKRENTNKKDKIEETPQGVDQRSGINLF